MYLTQEELSQIRKKLNDQRNQILKLATRSQNEWSMTSEKGDELDLATVDGIAAITNRLRGREIKLLKKIEKQLRWMNDEEFGYCMECEDEIGFKRLFARSTATRCISCKEAQEREELGIYHPRRRPTTRGPR